jgi:hypothetical protein
MKRAAAIKTPSASVRRGNGVDEIDPCMGVLLSAV